MEDINKEDNEKKLKEFNLKYDILTDIELRTAEIKAPNPVIEGLLYKQSVTVLAGNPKARKSFMALEQALSVTNGEPFLDHYNTICSNVFMISLEDGKIRLNNRLNKLAYQASGKFSFTTKYFNIKELEKLIILRNESPFKIDFIIIDTYSKFFGCDFKDSYRAHYKNITQLKELAEEYDIAILIIHHTTKKINEDWTQNLLGSQGITGAVDTIMYLDRKSGSDDGVLYVTGRDVEEQSINITFNNDNCRWIKSKLQKDNNIQLSPEREEIYKILRDKKEPMQLKYIADKVGKSTTAVQNLLKKLFDNNLVKIVKTGFYQVQDRKQVDSMDVVEDDVIESVDTMEHEFKMESVDTMYSMENDEIESMDKMEHEFQMDSVDTMDFVEDNEMELGYI